MANQFTSVATAGYSTNTVQTAYDLALGWALREMPMFRQWAVTKRPERPSMPGSSVVLNKYDWFSTAAVTAAKTPLNEEQDVDSTKLPATLPITLTFNEYGFAVTKTKKLRYYSFGDVDTYAVAAVADHLGRTLDELIQDELVNGTQKFFSGGAANEGAIDNTKLITGADLRKTKTKLKANNVVPPDGIFFTAGLHPHVSHDLRQETGSNGWRVPHEYGADQGSIWRGEIGAFEGFRFVENNYCRRTQTGSGGTEANSVYRTFVLGREALAEGVYEEPHTVIGPVTDKLQRFATLGWYGVLGWKVYRNEAIVQILSGSSVSTI